MAEPNDVRDVLEAERRSVAPRPGGFDRLMRRRKRRQTSQRLGAALVALALAGGATWGLAVAFRSQPVQRPARPAPTIDLSTATRLHVAWSYASPDLDPIKPPAVGGGVVLLLGHEHLLRAYPATCGLHVCTAIWKFQLPLLVSENQPSGPVIDAGKAYVFEDRLYAFDLPCGAEGGEVCRPAWASAPTGPTRFQPDLVVDGSLIVVATDRGLEAYDVARCRRLGSTCRPSWTYQVPGGATGVAVGDGIVVATSPTGVYAFVHPCQKDLCSPTWTDSGGPERG